MVLRVLGRHSDPHVHESGAGRLPADGVVAEVHRSERSQVPEEGVAFAREVERHGDVRALCGGGYSDVKVSDVRRLRIGRLGFGTRREKMALDDERRLRFRGWVGHDS
jgi:hypothetical protein